MKKTAYAALVAAMLATAACTANGTANITVPNATINASGSVKEAYVAADTSDVVKQTINTSDYYSYRAQSDSADVNVWIIYYYAPSTGKSYRCRSNASTKAVIDCVEITGQGEAYKPDYKIEKEKVKVSNDDAKSGAVTIINQTIVNNNTTNTNVDVNVNQNVTVNNIQNIQLISPKECQEQTGKTTASPVWLVVTQNTKVYINAETKETIATVPSGGMASPMPTASPTMAPASPTPMPSMSADVSASGTVEVETGASPTPAATASPAM